jgi:hypothetical protein
MMIEVVGDTWAKSPDDCISPEQAVDQAIARIKQILAE